MLNDIQKLFMIKAVQLKNKQGLDAVTWLQDCDNLTEDEIDSILTACGIEYTPSLDNVKAKKHKELSKICEERIFAGVDVDINGLTKHFSLTEHDQLNLFGKQVQLASGAEQLEYHADGQACCYYSAAEMQLIIETAMAYVSYNTTYCNALYMWINGCKTIEEVKSITWGSDVPVEYQSDVLQNYLAKIAASTETN